MEDVYHDDEDYNTGSGASDWGSGSGGNHVYDDEDIVDGSGSWKRDLEYWDSGRREVEKRNIYFDTSSMESDIRWDGSNEKDIYWQKRELEKKQYLVDSSVDDRRRRQEDEVERPSDQVTSAVL